MVVGSVEHLEFKTGVHNYPGGNQGVETVCRYEFLGLPAGASVISCCGFDSAVTPVRASSWERLKLIYR